MTGNFQSIANDYTSKGSTDKAITLQESSRVNQDNFNIKRKNVSTIEVDQLKLDTYLISQNLNHDIKKLFKLQQSERTHNEETEKSTARKVKFEEN